MDHATPGSSFTVGQELVEEHLRHAAAGVLRLRLRRLRRRAEDVVVGRRRADRGGRAAGPRGADPALALRAPPPASRPSTSTSAPRWSGCTTSGTRWAARPPTPRDATRRCWPSSAPSATATAGTLPTPPVVVAVPAAVVGRRRHRRRAELISRIVDCGHPHSSVDDLEPRLVAGDRPGPRVRARVRPHHGPHRRPTSRGLPSLDRARARAGWRCCSTGCPTSSTSSRRPSLIYGVPKLARGLGPRRPARPTRSRPTRRRSSGCSTTCSSTPTAAPGCPRCSWRSGSETVFGRCSTPPPA